MNAPMKGFAKSTLAALLAVLIGLAFAQGDGGSLTVNAQDNPDLGSHLTDDEGRTMYLFVNENAESSDSERMTEGVRSNAAACEGPCLENWPPVEAASVEAGEGLDSELLYTADVGGRQQAVYNGWPLYYFANDAEPGQATGQGLGGDGNMWYAVNAEGTAITSPPSGSDVEGGAADDGAMDDATEDGAAGDGAAGDGAAGDGAAGDGAAGDGAMDDVTDEPAMDGAPEGGAADDGGMDGGAAGDGMDGGNGMGGGDAEDGGAGDATEEETETN